MSLETHNAGEEDVHLQGLQCGIRPTASYISERRSSTFVPQASADITPAGSRLLRFKLSDQSGFLDGSPLRLTFKLNNKHNADPLNPLGVTPNFTLSPYANYRQRERRDRRRGGTGKRDAIVGPSQTL